MALADDLRACLSEILGREAPEVPQAYDDPVRFYRQWLAESNLGLVPMTGLTLPLISTGGSSLLASLSCLGLALGLSARAEPALDSDSFRG